jgi:hypothetical protein
MSISRTADTITVTGRTESGLPTTMEFTALSDGRVTFAGAIIDRAAALETALALVATATDITVHRPNGSPNYLVECGDEVQKLLPADWEIDPYDKTAAWVVFDLLRLLGKPAAYAMAGESQESLAREFPYLTDDQAKAISNYFASLAN